ncbi:hypothetical protein [Aquimarina rhabdastrellae]
MKNIVMIMMFLIGITAIAQEKNITAEQKQQAEEQLKIYFEKLNLTDEQKTVYETTVKDHANQMKMIKDSGLSKADKIREIQKIQHSKDTRLQQVLSKEQYEVYLEFKKERQQVVKANYTGEFSEYIERLALEEHQRDPFFEISKKYGTQLRSLKNSSQSRFSKYRAYKEIQKNKNREMKTLLSSHQYEVYLDIQKEVQKKMKEQRKKKN